MKKILLFLLTTFLSLGTVQAQNDTQHWIAPLGKDPSAGTYQHRLYLSTSSTTPFPVTIYNNGTVIGTVTISFGNPQSFVVQNNLIETTNDAEKFVVSTKGLYLEGDFNFLCTLRSNSGSTHAEVLTSKGTAGLGTLFYAAATPVNQSANLSNTFASVLATEDNTTVTVSGYEPGVVFTNGWTGATTPSFTVNLDAGESYIIDAAADDSPINAAGGFIGAKIESTKDIVVSNGNYNGNFGTMGLGSDLIMDQSVPVDYLGNEFAIVKGNGLMTTPNVERVLIIAVEDDTEIYVNNALASGNPPIAIIDEGEWFIVPQSNYVLQGNGHYNMYINTTENVYVYQMLIGGLDNSNSGGYNYIPPLDCYLPKKISEVGLIQQIGTINATNLKLNITTESGATVTVNGAALPANAGPYPLAGTANWETYSVDNITGNITIESTKAMTAGMNGGVSTAGWGGYFAGFSTDPEIEVVTGECIPGLKIRTGDQYETYQWYLNGQPIPGANTLEITPTVPGEYYVEVLISGCNSRTSEVFEVYTCPTITTIDAVVCNDKTFTPVFTVSPQTIDPLKTVIVNQPAFGTVIVDAGTSDIYYTPDPGYNGPDTFTYQIFGDIGQYADTEIVTVNIEVIDLVVTPDTISGCEYDGIGTFDLSTADVTTFPGATFEYYPTLTDLNNGTNQIFNFDNYQSSEGSVYALVITPDGCEEPVEITLQYFPSPTVTDDTLTECYTEDEPVSAIFDLTTAVVTLDAPVTKEYYTTLANAEQGLNPIGNPSAFSSPSSEVFVKVINADGCFDIAVVTLVVIGPKYSEFLVDQYICLEDRVTLDAGAGYSSYQWSTGDTSPTITVGVGDYWVILGHDGCETRQEVTVYKTPEPVITKVDIENDNVTIHVTAGEPPYQYANTTTGMVWQSSNVFEDVPRGLNTFWVKDSFDCQPIAIPVIVPNVVNAITPNGDGNNDVVDYSELARLSYKMESLTLNIYDRYGSIIFQGNKTNGFKWDGKVNNKTVPTGTYWYTLMWHMDPDQLIKYEYNGWILVKNRE